MRAITLSASDIESGTMREVCAHAMPDRSAITQAALHGVCALREDNHQRKRRPCGFEMHTLIAG